MSAQKPKCLCFIENQILQTWKDRRGGKKVKGWHGGEEKGYKDYELLKDYVFVKLSLQQR